MSDLTPTENLLIEVLVARHRLGEQIWTFDSSAASRRAADSLAKRGLVSVMNGNVERTFRAHLTEAGRAEFMTRPYWAPVFNRLATLINGTEWDVTSWRDNWREVSQALSHATSDSSSTGSDQ